ncbi:hypothetical protein [Bacillus paralicheniformis]|uniref:hypothetical protein n=1 Tax=Bacillus paralicheniformis TaxID=1648923 RepID=UPI00128C39EE|nr:hypothetical protein [Bacillus paralicheniformis]MPQ27389.1 hypothetical protein [Bacillus paralicheniformis]
MNHIMTGRRWRPYLQSERGGQHQDQGVRVAGEEGRSDMRLAAYSPILAIRLRIETIRRLDTALLRFYRLRFS